MRVCIELQITSYEYEPWWITTRPCDHFSQLRVPRALRSKAIGHAIGARAAPAAG